MFFKVENKARKRDKCIAPPPPPPAGPYHPCPPDPAAFPNGYLAVIAKGSLLVGERDEGGWGVGGWVFKKFKSFKSFKFFYFFDPSHLKFLQVLQVLKVLKVLKLLKVFIF